ncbi:MAG TPA: hypothetical protein VFP58_07880 [Candidatus Eisenbacteria bacterium]|nr:hypothetical protein [Candidatus Eisenbacteria bacterium]
MRLLLRGLSLTVLCAWFLSAATGELLRWHVASEHSELGHHHDHGSANDPAGNAWTSQGHEHPSLPQQESPYVKFSRLQPQVLPSAPARFQESAGPEGRPPLGHDPAEQRKPPHLDRFPILLI